MSKFFRYLFWSIVIIYPLVSYLQGVLDTPEVYVSYSTGACVQVLTTEGPGDCSDLPEKYRQVWVE